MRGREPSGREQVQELLRQQAVLARFGELALKSEDLDDILTQACQLVGEALSTDLAKVVELQADGQTLIVRAGVGWKLGVVGVATLSLHERSSESYALKTGQPMISPDIDAEKRFDYPDFLKDNGVKAVVNVAILGSEDRPPFGILQVDSRVPREFTKTDILFLRGYANLLAAAVARLRSLEEMRGKNVELERLLDECRRVSERKKFLAKEVDHRAKNMLAVVQAALRLTKAEDISSFVRVISGRVAAMARAQTLLAADKWSGADLHMMLRDELASYFGQNGSGPRVELDGSPLALPAAAAQPFSMALHELATNAVKYGSLSRPTGLLRISWHINGADNSLQFRWAESGGPPVPGPPDRRGFGSRVLTNTLRMQLGGTIFMAWEPTGLICDFTMPLSCSNSDHGIAP